MKQNCFLHYLNGTAQLGSTAYWVILGPCNNRKDDVFNSKLYIRLTLQGYTYSKSFMLFNNNFNYFVMTRSLITHAK